MVGVISRKGDDLSFRSNFKSTEGMNLVEETVMNADEGVKGMVKRHVEIRGGEGNFVDDAFEEAFKQGMEFIVDAEVLEDEDFDEYDLESLAGLKVKCSDGWARPLIRKGDKQLLAFHKDFPVYILLENQHLFSQLPPLNTLSVEPKNLKQERIDTANLSQRIAASEGPLFFDDWLKDRANPTSWWEISQRDNQLFASLYTAEGLKDAYELPQSWIMTPGMIRRQSPRPGNEPPFSWILSILAVLIIGLWGLMKLFQKTGRSGMEGIIPVYNHYRMFEMAGMNGKQILWLLVPFYNIYVYYRFTEKFATNFALPQKWLHVLGTILPPALWAYIGFKKNVFYRGPEGDDLYMFDQLFVGDE